MSLNGNGTVNVNLTSQTWFWLQISIWIVIGLILALIGILAAWGIQEFWFTPLESKTIRKAMRKKKNLMILEADDGRLMFRIGDKLYPEGIVETATNKKTKRFWTGLIARNVEQPNPPSTNPIVLSEGEKKAWDEQKKIFDLLADLATKKTHLEGAKIPVQVGYYGKSILTRIAHIAGVETLQKLAELKPELFVGVDFTTLKTLFGMPWDQTQLAAQAQQKWQEGYWKGKKDSGGQEPFKTILLMLIVVFGLLAACIIIMKFL